ncbi:MAG: LD-carboxypeptidase [Muribaculaceae bacterium]|nr:LD-carboxypeptidase [Muribaculaceae bacterium]
MDLENNDKSDPDDFNPEEFDSGNFDNLKIPDKSEDIVGGIDYFIRHKTLFYPQPLKKGDKIALISPASEVKEEYVFGAMSKIMQRGYQPVLMEYALGPSDGSFASSKINRLTDLFNALKDEEIKAIMCTRGGYGCAQLLANFSYGMVASNPKWIIGFSDVSALLALWYSCDVASIHGPMAKHLANMPDNDPCSEALFKILENGGKFDYSVGPHPYNIHGKTSGILLGGNLAVLNDLADTTYDLLANDRREKDVILFLEDINEPIYKVNRILWRLLLSGRLFSVKGLIFGQFTDYKPDKNFTTMEDMINEFLNRYIMPEIPIVFNFPTGHTDLNFPLVEGAEIELEVREDFVRLHTI